MAGKTGPNYPHGHPPVDKVRQLQRRLWVAAKRAPIRGAVTSRRSSTNGSRLCSAVWKPRSVAWARDQGSAGRQSPGAGDRSRNGHARGRVQRPVSWRLPTTGVPPARRTGLGRRKDERGVGYAKRSAIASQDIASQAGRRWRAFDVGLRWIADRWRHGTSEKSPGTLRAGSGMLASLCGVLLPVERPDPVGLCRFAVVVDTNA